MQLCGRGHSLYIPEETSMLAAYSCMTDREDLEPGSMVDDPELHTNKTEGFVCSVLENTHLLTCSVVLMHEMQTS